MRCGGTTLREHIKANLREEEALFLYGKPINQLPTVQSVNELILPLSEEQKKKIKIIFGHKVYFGIHKLFPNREPRYVVFLRNPVDRTISEYNYHRTVDKTEMARNTVFEGDRPLSFYESFSQKSRFHNYMFKHLFSNIFFFNMNEEGSFSGMPEKYVNEDNLKKIEEVLKTFYFVGITENQEDFELFYKMLGINPYHVRKNAAVKHFIPPDYGEIKKIILPMETFDSQIYEYALSLNEAFKNNNH